MFQTWKNKLSSLLHKNKKQRKKKFTQSNPNDSWIKRHFRTIFKKPAHLPPPPSPPIQYVPLE